MLTSPQAGQPEPHWRLGWSTGYASIAAPVGYQQHSYGYRDVDGAKVTDGNRQLFFPLSFSSLLHHMTRLD